MVGAPVSKFSLACKRCVHAVVVSYSLNSEIRACCVIAYNIIPNVTSGVVINAPMLVSRTCKVEPAAFC